MYYSHLTDLRQAITTRCPQICEVTIAPHPRALPALLNLPIAQRDVNDPSKPYGKVIVFPSPHKFKTAANSLCLDVIAGAALAIVTRTLCDKTTYAPAMADNELLVDCLLCALQGKSLASPQSRANPLQVVTPANVPEYDYIDGLWATFLGVEYPMQINCQQN